MSGENGFKGRLFGGFDRRDVAEYIEKLAGERNAIQAMAEHYNRLVIEPEKQIVGIAQAGCREEALYLESLIKAEKPPMEILDVEYEPVTGSHVGPGALALFFEGIVGVREMV